jgi:polysaccharide deacetylase 2 family uncharacterized protein YibQ
VKKSDLMTGETATEQTAEQANMQIAFAAVQAARKETFLANYSRKYKLFVVFVLFGFVIWAASKGMGSTERVPAVSPQEETAMSDINAEAVQSVPQSAPQTGPVVPKSDLERQAIEMNDGISGPRIQLSAAPDPDLVETSSAGSLPKVSPDGRKPWQVYARPFNFQDPRPRIALVMTDLGISRVATDAALRRLPPAVTLSFDVQGHSLDSWLQRARQDGHETLLSLSMEPYDYPRSDPGPGSLLTTLPNVDNMQRLLNALRLGSGYVGVTSSSGSRFMSDSPKLMPIMAVLKNRGLLIFDPKIATHSAVSSLAFELGVPSAVALREIDVSPTPDSIDEALAQLEQSARVEGSVVGIASPLPLTMERIEAWAKKLPERGVVLAPLTAVVK